MKIKWYDDKNIAVFFSVKPDVGILYPSPDLSDEENEAIEQKPFICRNKVKVALFDLKTGRRFVFTIEAGYRWDGASIPWIFWRIIGSKTDNRFLIPSLIHDKLCENHALVNYDRYFADKVFERLLYVSGVPAIKRWAMFHGVDNFQKFQGWEEKK